MALLVVVGLIYSLQSATRGRLMSQCMIFNIVPKQTPAREEIRGMNAFVKNCRRTAARTKLNFGWIQFYWCHVYYNHGCLTEPEPSEKKKGRERESCDIESLFAFPDYDWPSNWMVFQSMTLALPSTIVRVYRCLLNGTRAARYFCRAPAAFCTFPPNTKERTPAFLPSLTLHRLSFTLLCETQQPWRTQTSCATRLHHRQDLS